MNAVRPTKKEVVTAFRTREILAAARRLMTQKAIETVTMDDIAQAAGVAKGTIYLYFSSKKELIQALLSQTGENLLRDIEGILDTRLSPREKLHQVLTVLVHHLERERVLFPVYLREMQQTGPESEKKGKPRFQEIEDKIVTHLTRLFAEGISQGQFAPYNPRLLTYLLKGLIRATGYYQMVEGCPNIVQEVLPVLSTLIFSGLTPKPGMSEEVAQR